MSSGWWHSGSGPDTSWAVEAEERLETVRSGAERRGLAKCGKMWQYPAIGALLHPGPGQGPDIGAPHHPGPWE